MLSVNDLEKLKAVISEPLQATESLAKILASKLATVSPVTALEFSNILEKGLAEDEEVMTIIHRRVIEILRDPSKLHQD